MSNILTSYIRFYRKDLQALSREEAEYLLPLSATQWERFGSYWVRILCKNRAEEACLDIHYGSGKRTGNLLETEEIARDYIVWERIADEGGGPDRLFCGMSQHPVHAYWEMNFLAPCLYAYNSIRIRTDELPEEFDQWGTWKSLRYNSFELKREGMYQACNSRSFVDLQEDSPFYGPQIGYSQGYISDYFVPSEDAYIVQSSCPFIQRYFLKHQDLLPECCRIELLWNGRVVQSIEKKKNWIEHTGADYWDNCQNNEWKDFTSALSSAFLPS